MRFRRGRRVARKSSSRSWTTTWHNEASFSAAVGPGPVSVGNVGTPHNVELPVYAKGPGGHGLSTGSPAVFCSAERSRAARRPTRTPITTSHSEMTVGPMMVSTREAVVGSPVKA